VYKVGDNTTICQEVLHCSGRMHRDVWKYPTQCNIYLRRITTYFGRKLRCYINREMNLMYGKYKESTCMSCLKNPISQPSMAILPIWYPSISKELSK